MSLHLTRLRVEQLRQFRQPFELRDLAPGLNLITGPNEAGKSTLVRAIRAAFFERYKTKSVEDLLPWGESSSSARPSVALDFNWQGQPWTLAKTFLSRQRCTLNVAGQQLENDEAEARIAELLGFQFAGKGVSKPEHWGIPGLLWVEQGQGQQLSESAKNAREHLHDALRGLSAGDEALGALAASGGDDVLAELQAQLAELKTPTGREKGELLQTGDKLQEVAAGLAELDARIAQHRQQVDTLASLRQQWAQTQTQRPLDVLRQQLVAAQKRLADLNTLAQTLAEQRQRQQEQLAQRELWLAQQQSLQTQSQQLAQRQQALAQAEVLLGPAQTGVQQAQARLAACAAQTQAAQASWVQARQTDQRSRLYEQWLSAQDEVKRLRALLERAQAEQERLEPLRRSAVQTAIAEQTLQTLQVQERQLDALRLRQQALATRLQFKLPVGYPLRLSGAGERAGGVAGSAAGGRAGDTSGVLATQLLTGQGECLLTAAATLYLPGGGELTLIPGGADVGELALEEARLSDALQTALHQAGLESVAQAQARWLAQTEVQRQIALAEQALKLVAPQGLEALRSALGQADARRQAAQDGLASLASSAGAPPGAAPEVASEVAPAAAGAAPATPAPAELPSLAQAQAALDLARQSEAVAQDALSQAREHLAACQSRQLSAERELQAAQAALADPAYAQRQAQTHQGLQDLQAQLLALAGHIELGQAQLQAAQPDIARQDIERLTRSTEQQEAAQQQCQLEIARLEAALQQAGAQGLEEARAALAGEQERLQRRHTELQRRAEALNFLCQRLQAKRQATLARLQAPLQQRLQHYLRLLLPQAQLHLDEQLLPTRLLRPDASGAPQAGDFEDLSFGAREQLGLIARLAYADLLREAGRPTLLILDDVLSHSDAQRLDRMKPVLFDAATRHQILLFTCHPTWWRDLGASAQAIDLLRSQAPAAP